MVGKQGVVSARIGVPCLSVIHHCQMLLEVAWIECGGYYSDDSLSAEYLKLMSLCVEGKVQQTEMSIGRSRKRRHLALHVNATPWTERAHYSWEGLLTITMALLAYTSIINCPLTDGMQTRRSRILPQLTRPTTEAASLTGSLPLRAR